MRPLVSFDWAIKRLLRQKANYSILEGFLSELLKQEIIIQNILESEANADYIESKINKVDILCETDNKELILIELQYNSELDYMHRMLFGSSKLITDYIAKGDPYDKVRKVYSINIVYFNLGQGEDYIYHGTTTFQGIHNHDILKITESQRKLFNIEQFSDVFPEYYVIKVNQFNDLAKDTLDDWIYYLKNDQISSTTQAKGLTKAAEILNIDNMDPATKIEYDAFIKEQRISENMLFTAKFEGREEGREEGLAIGEAKGREKSKIEIILSAFENKVPVTLIATITKLSEDEVIKILKDQEKI
jgi:predicted transposase/invertase (TIGR01784 family)